MFDFENFKHEVASMFGTSFKTNNEETMRLFMNSFYAFLSKLLRDATEVGERDLRTGSVIVSASAVNHAFNRAFVPWKDFAAP